MADAPGALGGELDSGNQDVSVSNERRQSFQDLYLFGKGCLEQLRAHSALVRIPTPKPPISEPEDQDDVELSVLGIFQSVQTVASCLVPAGFGTPVYVKPLEQPQFLFVPISDGGPGAKLYDDTLWGIRCSGWVQHVHGLLPRIDDPFFVFPKYPASHIVLYESPAVTLEEIHKSCAGAVYPGRVAIIELSRLRRLGINIARCTELMVTFNGPHIFANQEAEMRCHDRLTWWAETWVPREAIFGYIGFSEFVQLCQNFFLVDQDNGPRDLVSFYRSRDDRRLFREDIFAHVKNGIGASPSLAPPWPFITPELEQAFLAVDGSFASTLQQLSSPTGTPGQVGQSGLNPRGNTLIGSFDPPIVMQPVPGNYHDSPHILDML